MVRAQKSAYHKKSTDGRHEGSPPACAQLGSKEERAGQPWRPQAAPRLQHAHQNWSGGHHDHPCVQQQTPALPSASDWDLVHPEGHRFPIHGASLCHPGQTQRPSLLDREDRQAFTRMTPWDIPGGPPWVSRISKAGTVFGSAYCLRRHGCFAPLLPFSRVSEDTKRASLGHPRDARRSRRPPPRPGPPRPGLCPVQVTGAPRVVRVFLRKPYTLVRKSQSVPRREGVPTLDAMGGGRPRTTRGTFLCR